MKIKIIVVFFCLIVCVSSALGGDGELIYNSDLGLVGLANTTSKVSGYIDWKFKIIALVDSKGDTLVYQIEKKEITLAKDANCTGNQTFQEYFSTIKSFASLTAKGKTYSITDAPNHPKILHILNFVNNRLGHKTRENSTDGIEYLQNSVPRIVECSKLYEIIFKGKGKIAGIPADGDRLLNALLVLNILFKQELNKLGDNTIDLGAILNTKNGPKAFIFVLEAVQGSVDLSKISALQNVQETFNVLVLLGTKNPSGIDGYYTVLFNIVSLVQGNGDLTKVVKSIIDYWAKGGFTNEANQEQLEFCTKGLEIIEQTQNSATLNSFRNLLEGLKYNQLSINGVDFSKILTVLVKGKPEDALHNIVEIVLGLGCFLEPETGVQKLFQLLVTSLNTTEGIDGLKKLIPNIGITSAFLGNGNPLEAILKGSNIINLVNSHEALLDIQNVPVIGGIFAALSKEVRVVSNGSLDVKEILNPLNLLNVFENIVKDGVSFGGSIVPVVFENGVQIGINSVANGFENVF